MSAGRTVFAVCVQRHRGLYDDFGGAFAESDARCAQPLSRDVHSADRGQRGYVADIVGDSVMSVWLADASPAGPGRRPAGDARAGCLHER